MTHADTIFKGLSKRDKDNLARRALVAEAKKKVMNQRFRAGKKARDEVRVERWFPRDHVGEVRQLLSLYADVRKRGEALWIRVALPPDGQDSGLVIDAKDHLIRQHSMVIAGRGRETGTHPGTTSLRDRFYMPSYKDELKDLIAGIVTTEGPLPLDVLELKVAKRHGFASTGTKIRDRIAACLDGAELHVEPQTNRKKRTFVWARDKFGPRAPWRGRRERELADISRHEWAELLDRHADELENAEDPVKAAAALAEVRSLAEPTRELLTSYRDWWLATPPVIDHRGQGEVSAGKHDEIGLI